MVRIAIPQLSPAALRGHAQDAIVRDLAGETMGTSWRVRFAAPPACDPAPLRAAIVARLDGIVGEMSHWQPESRLSAFNRARAGQWIALPPDFATVVAAALDIARLTDGAFDPAIGRLVDLRGFGPAGPCAANPAAIAAARAAAGWTRLAYDPAARRLRQPGGLSLDLSGIAKGHAVDAVAGLLGTAGLGHCLVEIGGELAGRGLRPDGDPWWVDLEDPPGAAPRPLRIALHEIAVATSGDYRRGGHTIDPRTGRSAGNGLVSVSVLHQSAMLADAWATALTVLGPAAGLALATHHAIAARLIVGGAESAERITPALAAMIDEI